ncbi:hypothetical protein JX266_002651 [Neoarthrinium moseri]|nr:hypothetical protein JX266_002651 [Neoarthrinium moseri]
MAPQVSRQAAFVDLSQTGTTSGSSQYACGGEPRHSSRRGSPRQNLRGSDAMNSLSNAHASTTWSAQPMERVTARAPELRKNRKVLSKESSTSFSWLPGRKGKKAADRTSISHTQRDPTEKRGIPRVVDFQIPDAPGPNHLGRPANLPSPQLLPAHRLQSRSQHVVGNYKPDPKKLVTDPALWNSSHPVRRSLARPQQSEENRPLRGRRVLSEDRSQAQEKPVIEALKEFDQRDGFAARGRNWSTTVVIGDKEPATQYTSFPPPCFDEETATTEKQMRRRAVYFKPSDIPADLAQLADQQEDNADDAPADISYNEPRAVSYLSLFGSDQECDGEDSEEEDREQLELPSIFLTPPSRKVSEASVLSTRLLSPGHAWKLLAEDARRDAVRERRTSDKILAYCSPLIAALQVLQGYPEFDGLEEASWEGLDEVLRQVLEDRDMNGEERDHALASAAWFREQWWRLYRESKRQCYVLQHPTEDGAAVEA